MQFLRQADENIADKGGFSALALADSSGRRGAVDVFMELQTAEMPPGLGIGAHDIPDLHELSDIDPQGQSRVPAVFAAQLTRGFSVFRRFPALQTTTISTWTWATMGTWRTTPKCRWAGPSPP